MTAETPAEMIRDFTRRHGSIKPPCLDGCGLNAHSPLTCQEAKAEAEGGEGA